MISLEEKLDVIMCVAFVKILNNTSLLLCLHILCTIVRYLYPCNKGTIYRCSYP